MKLLLDTCTFLWLIDDVARLSAVAREALADSANEALLSAASSWEIAIKVARGKLRLAEAPARMVPKQRSAHQVLPLPIGEDEVLATGRLPALHRDPFDRLLVCQAIEYGLVILTPDELIRQYSVKTLW